MTKMALDAPGDKGKPQGLSKMRRAIVASMALSAQIPQFTLDRWVGLADASALRDDLRAAGIGASWEDLLVAASARALRAHPAVNSSFDETGIIEHPDVNVGIATALADGLVSPAIMNADRRTFQELVDERKRLRGGAAAGRLRGAEMFGATFTISNLGPYGVDRFRALVIPPQAAILAAGRVQDRAGAPQMALSLSCDHRALDGAPAAQFLGAVCELLEAPAWAADLYASTGLGGDGD
jgi:pyruvate dehydrogenase E2 component (dihydrolipoamide acetyltransferase)